MRKTKIRRRNRVFRRRRVGRTIGKIVLWLLVIPALIGGYYLAEYLFTRETAQPVDAPTTETTVSTGGDTAPTQAETPVPQTPDRTAPTNLRAIWLPTAALFDLSAWEDTLSGAQTAGYNAVIVDVKDADGNLWYASQTELALAARATKDAALTLSALQEAADTLETYSLTLVPRLYAFRDNTAPRYLEAAKVSVQGDPTSTWYDNDPSAGGRRWLNPYAADARRYITALSAELSNAGFSLLMLDGVQFPDQEYLAYYGDATQTALSRSELMAQFAAEMNAAVGEDGWLLCSTALAAVGEQTTVYGGNPVTFGAPAVSPWVLPSQMGKQLTLSGETVAAPAEHPYEAVTLLLSQLNARLQFMEESARPVIVPWLQADGYSAAQIAEEVRAVTAQLGTDAPYILYRADGRYTFA